MSEQQNINKENINKENNNIEGVSDYAKYIINYRPEKGLEEELADLMSPFIKEKIISPIAPLHCTIFSMDSLKKYESEISKMFSETKYFIPKIVFTHLDVFHDVLVLRTQKEKYLTKNHHISFKKFCEYISHDSESYKATYEMPMTTHQRTILHQFGSQFFGEFYTPHISLGNILNETRELQKLVLKYLKTFSEKSWVPKEAFLSRKVPGQWEDLEIISLS